MDFGVGYVTLSDDLHGFKEIGQLPSHLSELDEGDGIIGMAAIVVRNGACWHKTCNATKLERARKRLYKETDVNVAQSNISDDISFNPSPTKLECLTRSSDVTLDRSRVSHSLCFSVTCLYKAHITVYYTPLIPSLSC